MRTDGLALRGTIPQTLFAEFASSANSADAVCGITSEMSGLLLFDDLAPDLVVRVDLGEICRAGDFLSCRVNERNHALGKIEFPQFHVGAHCIKSGGCYARGKIISKVILHFTPSNNRST